VRLNRDRVLMNELCPRAVKLELKFRMRSTGIRILHAPLLMKLCNCTEGAAQPYVLQLPGLTPLLAWLAGALALHSN
jgi:hypothetical protein